MNTHAHQVFVGGIIKRSVSLQNMKQILPLNVLFLFSPCAHPVFMPDLIKKQFPMNTDLYFTN